MGQDWFHIKIGYDNVGLMHSVSRPTGLCVTRRQLHML